MPAPRSAERPTVAHEDGQGLPGKPPRIPLAVGDHVMEVRFQDIGIGLVLLVAFHYYGMRLAVVRTRLKGVDPAG